MFPLPPALHHQCQATVHELLSGAQDVVDSADVLAIGAWFGTLSAPTPGFLPVQRRHLLMLLLTLRHVAPAWEGRGAHDADLPSIMLSASHSPESRAPVCDMLTSHRPAQRHTYRTCVLYSRYNAIYEEDEL
jgi:hypothetical protein